MPSFLRPACCLGILTIGIAAAAPAAEADRDPWGPYRFLMGEWTGEGSGQSGPASGSFTFRPELHGKVLVRRGRTERPRGADQPAAIREDLMVVYPAEKGRPARALSWDNEGHVIQYTAHPSPDSKSLVFLGETVPSQPRLRLTYKELGEDRVGIDLAVAPAGKPDEFKTSLEGKARRAPRSEVGVSLPRGYVAYRADRPITLDGKLDEPAWKAVPWTESFVDIEGDRKPIPRLETRAKMLWDDQYFYVAAYLEEPHVWGTLTKHDSVIFQDNDFEIFIDPDGDNHEYYEIEINALNTEWDLFLGKPYRDGGPAVNEWEIPGLKTGVHVEGTLNNPGDRDGCWTVEFAIPWKVMAEYAHRPSPPRDGDQWRINFSRVEWEIDTKDGKYAKVPNRREDNWVWSPQGFVDMHRPEYWGFVQFSTATPGTDHFRGDSAIPVRDRLIEIYHAQRRYHGANKRYAERLDALGLPPLPVSPGGLDTTLTTSADGFQASIRFTPAPKDEPQTWRIDQQSRISRVSSPQ
ncbi:MAG: carbohydrate-binding family 9-like protein [Isosphaeraceae bacterium]